jgi:hypothetical protein
MTKTEFLAHVTAIYTTGNVSDSHDDPRRADWTRPAMAGYACCAKLDEMLQALVECCALTAEETQAFYDAL